MSAPAPGLENTDPRMRYVPPAVKAADDMHRLLRDPVLRKEVMPPESIPPADIRPVSATLADRLDQRNLDCEEQIAAAIRRFTFIGFVDWYEAAIKGKNRDEIYQWAMEYGTDA